MTLETIAQLSTSVFARPSEQDVADAIAAASAQFERHEPRVVDQVCADARTIYDRALIASPSESNVSLRLSPANFAQLGRIVNSGVCLRR